MTYTLRKSHERKIWFSEVIRYLKDRQSDLLTEIQGALSETPNAYLAKNRRNGTGLVDRYGVYNKSQ